jgi:hypothetical protein
MCTSEGGGPSRTFDNRVFFLYPLSRSEETSIFRKQHPMRVELARLSLRPDTEEAAGTCFRGRHLALDVRPGWPAW